MKLVFAHGWGFDARVWDALALLLPEWEQAREDRGYFGPPRTPLTDAPAVEGPCLAVTHSFGTMRLLAAPPPGLAGIVAICGFDRFSEAPGYPGVAARVIARMLSAFERQPEAVLADFRQQCGCVDPAPAPDPARLRGDLVALRDADMRTQTAGLAVPILALNAAGDAILPEAMRAATFGSAKTLERRCHPTAGHLLPTEDPQWCAAAIRAFAGTLA